MIQACSASGSAQLQEAGADGICQLGVYENLRPALAEQVGLGCYEAASQFVMMCSTVCKLNEQAVMQLPKRFTCRLPSSSITSQSFSLVF